MAGAAVARVALSGVEKTAVLLMAIGEEAGAQVMRNLPRDQVLRVVAAISDLGTIRRTEIDAVLAEAWELSQQRQGERRGDPAYLRRVLEGAFDAESVGAILVNEPEAEVRPKSVASLDNADSKRLLRLLRSEHPQAVAILLGQMKRIQAAELLGALPVSMRADVALRMARLQQIPMQVVDKVAGELSRRLGQSIPESTVKYRGTHAIADLVNSMDPQIAEETLQAIGEADPELSDVVRDLLFVFEDLVQIDTTAIREIVSRADRRLLTVALKGTSDRLKEHILKTMSQRGGATLQEDMGAMGPVKVKEVMDAQKAILAILRKLEAEGAVSTRGSEQQYVE